jgi:hypothetical protein
MNNIGPPSAIRSADEEHLRLLAIFHYVMAAIGAVFACFPLIHIALGVMMVAHPGTMAGGGKGTPPPPGVGYFFIVIGSLLVLAGWTAAVCTFISGRFLARRRRRLFSFVVAAILCMFVPFGTVLGIFTIIVLSRESVQRLYQSAAAPPA